jgi:hypothetical protein
MHRNDNKPTRRFLQCQGINTSSALLESLHNPKLQAFVFRLCFFLNTLISYSWVKNLIYSSNKFTLQILRQTFSIYPETKRGTAYTDANQVVFHPNMILTNIRICNLSFLFTLRKSDYVKTIPIYRLLNQNGKTRNR